MKLHKYQERAIQYAIEHRASFMMLDVGFGKTAIALKTIQAVKRQTVVFAPLRVATVVWPEEIEKWVPELTYSVIHGKLKGRKLALTKDIYIVSYSSVKWFFDTVVNYMKDISRFFLILDESSMIKSPSTKRFKMIAKLASVMSEYKMNLSATPSPNGLHELWSQYYILDEGHRLEDSFYKYRTKYFDYTGPPMYKTTLKPWHDKLIADRIDDMTFRLDPNEYLELPEITYNKILIDVPTKVMTVYKKLEKDFFVKISGEEITAFNAAAKSMKLRQLIQGALYTVHPEYAEVHDLKIQVLKEMLEAHSSSCILCAIQFRFELEMIRKAIGKVPYIIGGVSADNSAPLVKEWNLGKLPLLVCHPASISHGMNLQAGGNVIIWFGLPWSLEMYKQLNGRLHRQGQKRAVVVNNFVLKGTLDELILEVLSTKNATQQHLLDRLKTVADWGTLPSHKK